MGLGPPNMPLGIGLKTEETKGTFYQSIRKKSLRRLIQEEFDVQHSTDKLTTL
jgi:hypothetical protein